MKTRPAERLKAEANLLARVLASSEGVMTLRLMRSLGLLSREERAEGDVRPPPQADRIGVWTRAGSPDGSFRRVQTEEDGYWADAQQIPRKAGSRRIVLLGESVARSYFYDPVFTCASALGHFLQERAGSPCEVVDLAKTNLGLADLIRLLAQVKELEPDALVVFAGNNWSGLSRYFNPGAAERSREVVSRSELGSLRPAATRCLERRAELAVNAIAETSRALGIPAVMVIPEFNLAQWRDPHPLMPPPLPPAKARQWLESASQAKALMAEGDRAGAAAHAHELVELDQGLGALGPAILGWAALRSGATAEARGYLEQARDAEVWWTPQRLSPRCTRPVQDSLREHAAARGILPVDLPALFDEHSNGELPGQRYFMDYCHLSAAGINVAMAGVAQELLGALWGVSAQRDEVLRRSSGPSDEEASAAHLLAAIHNAHWDQPKKTLEGHCAESARLGARAGAHFALLLDFLGRSTRAEMCASFGQLCEGLGRQALKRATGWSDRLYADLVEAASPFVERPAGGAAPAAKHDFDLGELDLLGPRYSLEGGALGSLPDGRHTGRAFFRASQLESVFGFALTSARRLVLRLTVRVPAARAAAAVKVQLNGTDLAGVEVDGARWTTVQVPLEADRLRPGLNRLALRWPLLDESLALAAQEASRLLSVGDRFVYSAPVGDIFALTLSAAPPAPAVRGAA